MTKEIQAIKKRVRSFDYPKLKDAIGDMEILVQEIERIEIELAGVRTELLSIGYKPGDAYAVKDAYRRGR